MSFATAFDAAIRNEFLDLGDVLELGGLPDDLQPSVSAGELTLDEARAIVVERAVARTALDGGEGR